MLSQYSASHLFFQFLTSALETTFWRLQTCYLKASLLIFGATPAQSCGTPGSLKVLEKKAVGGQQ